MRASPDLRSGRTAAALTALARYSRTGRQELQAMVTAHPDRFAAFATPPVTVAAAAEL
jgi:hypothetical protein